MKCVRTPKFVNMRTLKSHGKFFHTHLAHLLVLELRELCLKMSKCRNLDFLAPYFTLSKITFLTASHKLSSSFVGGGEGAVIQFHPSPSELRWLRHPSVHGLIEIYGVQSWLQHISRPDSSRGGTHVIDPWPPKSSQTTHIFMSHLTGLHHPCLKQKRSNYWQSINFFHCLFNHCFTFVAWAHLFLKLYNDLVTLWFICFCCIFRTGIDVSRFAY